MITPIEQILLKSLVELEKAVNSARAAKSKPDLAALFARIDELAKQLPRGTDPNLLHYLQKKSYQKARLCLQGLDAENQVGNCRHVN